MPLIHVTINLLRRGRTCKLSIKGKWMRRAIASSYHHLIFKSSNAGMSALILNRTPLPPIHKQDSVTSHQEVGENDFHDIVRDLGWDVEGIREVAEATARTMPANPPQAKAINQKAGGNPRH